MRGDQMKMREAVEGAIRLCTDAIEGGEYMGEGPDPYFDKIKKLLSAALSAPARNCDMCRDVDEAYNQFMCYVKRENPAFTKSSPLHTVWDALKWVLDGAAKEQESEVA